MKTIYIGFFLDQNGNSSRWYGIFENGSFVEGCVIPYHKDGGISVTGEYLNGIQFGLWTFYNNIGEIYSQCYYVKNSLESKLVFPYLNQFANFRITQ